MRRTIRAWMLLLMLVMGMTLGVTESYATQNTMPTMADELETTAAAPTTAAQETTAAVKKKKKKGNCDKYIGLNEKKYWVMATARRKIFVYRKKSVNSKQIGKFTKNNCIRVNTSLMVKGKKYIWLPVYMPNNVTGYVQLTDVKLGVLDVKTFGLEGDLKTKQNKQRIKICRFGLPYIGTKFILGGASLTRGIDCSTFARKAMRNAGVMVSNSALAVDLSNTGKKITREQLKAGDMLFYYNSSKDRRIGHCAIYIGGGYLINASGHQGKIYPSGGIRISKIDYRKPTAVKFRNLVGN